MRFYFLNTCYASPEQYDVFKANGDLCGYVRLRWGSLRADYPNVEGESIYTYEFEDNFKGIFDSDEEREYHLNKIAISYKNKILENVPIKIPDKDVSYTIFTDISQLEEVLSRGKE